MCFILLGINYQTPYNCPCTLPFVLLILIDSMEMQDTTTNPKPRATIVAFRLQGHVISTVHLVTKLASRGFTITFVNIEATNLEITMLKQYDVK